MMITGDHPLTAEAIAREVHIVRGRTRSQAAKALGIPETSVKAADYDAVVLHGEVIANMNEEQWAEVSADNTFNWSSLKLQVIFS